MFSIPHLLLILLIVLVLFGAGKLSSIMGDFGKGIRSFKEGLKGDEKPVDPKQITDNKDKNV